MRFEKFFEALGPMIAMAASGNGPKFQDGKFSMDGKEGAPLGELDLSGEVPDTVKLCGPDIVRITAGDEFTIAVEGEDEAKERMRFLLEDGALLVMRDREGWREGTSSTVTITMPAPRRLKLAGSGSIHADAMADEARIAVVGSGTVSTPELKVKSLRLKLAGSGTCKAAGSADSLDLSIAGSGKANMAGLKSDFVEIGITGSGSAVFASDGEVKARITGSGDVTVRGSARCKVKSFGSGTLTCEPTETVDS
jgi:hypothetical protein